MDRSWMNFSRVSADYRNGVKTFLNIAFANSSQENMILCPCKKCVNINWHNREVVEEHLIVHGFVSGYKKWVFHGELTPRTATSQSNVSFSPIFDRPSIREDDMEGMLRDAFNMHDNEQSIREEDCDIGVNDFTEMRRTECDEEPNRDATKFYKLLDEMNDSLYEGSKHSKLSFCIRLFHLKCLGGWTGKSFTQLLEFLREMFSSVKIPESGKDMKKMIKDLGLGYEKIHSCSNDCMLYWGDKKDQESCHVCGKSRWMNMDTQNVMEEEAEARPRKKPIKILRYFPLIPRLQRLFMSSKTCESMRWHYDGRTDDGLLRHLADCEAWKSFDQKFPSFARDP